MLPVMHEQPTSDRQQDAGQTPPANGVPASADAGAPRARRRGPPPNPLYHPLFLPVLITAYWLWSGWDGFFTTDPEMLEHKRFNQILFAITSVFGLWLIPRGIKEYRQDKAAAANRKPDGNSR